MTQRTDFQAVETDQQTSPAAPVSHLRSKRAVRIAVSLPIEIRDQFGGKDQARTQFVMLRGSVLASRLAVRVGQQLTIQNLKNNRSAECHVISVEHGLNGAHQIEVEFTGSQLEFWPVQFPEEESRVPAPARMPESGSFDLKSVPLSGASSDKGLLVLADSVAQDYSVTLVHSADRVATRAATVDSVAQFRAANRAAHRREQRKKAIYSVLLCALLSAVAFGARYWYTHKSQSLETAAPPELRSVAQKIARAIPAKRSDANQASAVDSAPDTEPAATSDVQSSGPAVEAAPVPIETTSHRSAVVSQPAAEKAPASMPRIQTEAQISVRHGSSFAAARNTETTDAGEGPLPLPLQVGQTASLTKPDALKEVVAVVPAQTAVLAAQVPKRAVPAHLTRSVPAQYPPMARQLHVEGEVMLEVEVDTGGGVSGVKVVSGPPLLRTAAVDCVKRWKYQPATLGDKPVASTEIVKLDFHWR